MPFADQLKVHPQSQQRELTPRPLRRRAPGRLHSRPHLRRHALQQLAVLVGLSALLLGLLIASAFRSRFRWSASALSFCSRRSRWLAAAPLPCRIRKIRQWRIFRTGC